MKKFVLILIMFATFFSIKLISPSNSFAACGGSSQVCCASAPPCSSGLSCIAGHCTPSGTSLINKTTNPTDGCTNGINTAIGCIPVLNNDNGASFAGFILRWGIGVGSGIAFLLIVYASFMIMTSQGDPNRLKAGQELLTSAISGLILLIFSIFVLKFIGIDILGLDTWGFGK